MEILSPAKINLFLQVVGKRIDGYHELFTLMCPISLYDRISMEMDAETIRVRCSNPDVPEDGTNLAYRAAALFFQCANIQSGVAISIEKQIPVAAGLGGGSSNAASVLCALNRHYGVLFSQGQLMKMGLKLGADVPFFIFNRPAIATGIGEQLTPYERLQPFHVVVLALPIRVSTAEVYKNLNLGLTKCKKELKNLFFKIQNFDAVHYLCNDLETYTASKFPEIEAAKTALRACGAAGALMSGSGSAVFGLFPQKHRCQQAVRELQNEKWTVYSAEMLL